MNKHHKRYICLFMELFLLLCFSTDITIFSARLFFRIIRGHLFKYLYDYKCEIGARRWEESVA